jgi:hypothetical protein
MTWRESPAPKESEISPSGNPLRESVRGAFGITGFLTRNDPLDAVWRESEKSRDFVQKAWFHDVAAVIVSQQRFIATMQGRTASFSTFSDAQFDEAAFEAQLGGTSRPQPSAFIGSSSCRRDSC